MVANGPPEFRRYELLDWDTEFFGFPVARIDPRLEADALAETLAELRRRSVGLAYWLPPESEALRVAAQRLGAVIAGTQVRYVRALDPVSASPRPVGARVLPAAPDALRELVALGLEAARWSRFALDPRMPPGAAERMYRIWVRRSLEREIADEVLVARDDAGGAAGMISLVQQHDLCVIGLVAVNGERRRQGFGRQLVRCAFDWSIRRGLRQIAVTALSANVAACRLYEACGFRPDRRSMIAHFWLQAR